VRDWDEERPPNYSTPWLNMMYEPYYNILCLKIFLYHKPLL
jgi:hypothetical protein